MTVISETRRAD